MTQRIFAKIFAALVLMLTVVGAVAQGLSGDVPTIDIKNGTASATPIAVIPFAFEGAGLPPDTDVAAVIGNDLDRCGQFRTLPKSDIVEYPTRGSQIKFPT